MPDRHSVAGHRTAGRCTFGQIALNSAIVQKRSVHPSSLVPRQATRRWRILSAAGALLLLLGMPACESRPAPDPCKSMRHSGASGNVVSVDLETDELFLRITQTRTGARRDRTMVYKFEPESEIYIDDALRELADVKVGDSANIISHPDPLREGGTVAVLVVIDRNEPPLPDPDWMNPNTRVATPAEDPQNPQIQE
jgi:hypothetical protein